MAAGSRCGESQQRLHQVEQARLNGANFAAHPQPEIGGDLLVAAAAGVDLVRHLAGRFLELANDEGVNILVGRPVEKPRLGRLGENTVEGLVNAAALGGAQNPDALQRRGERLRADDVGLEQPAVEIERTREALEQLGRPFFKTASPQLHDFFAPETTAARTLIGRPTRLMKPAASFWSYSAPIVKLAMLSE